MSNCKLTSAQLKVLQYVADYGPMSRPHAFNVPSVRSSLSGRPNVRRDLWKRLHLFGWLQLVRPGDAMQQSKITVAGYRALMENKNA